MFLNGKKIKENIFNMLNNSSENFPNLDDNIFQHS